jgi:hypothetical protein
MPTIQNKRRTDPTDTGEINSIEAVTKGKTLPNEYIPAINLDNVIDLSQPAGSQGDSADTGITGKVSQNSLDKIFGGTGKIKTGYLLNNSIEASQENRISDNLIKVESSGPLRQFSQTGSYIGDELYKKTETDKQILIAPMHIEYKTFLGLTTFVRGPSSGNDEQKVLNQGDEITTHEFPFTVIYPNEFLEFNIQYPAFGGSDAQATVKLFRSELQTGGAFVQIGEFLLYGAGGLANVNTSGLIVDAGSKAIGPNNTPKTYYYRLVYKQDFGGNSNIYRGGTKILIKGYPVAKTTYNIPV